MHRYKDLYLLTYVSDLIPNSKYRCEYQIVTNFVQFAIVRTHVFTSRRLESPASVEILPEFAETIKHWLREKEDEFFKDLEHHTQFRNRHLIDRISEIWNGAKFDL